MNNFIFLQTFRKLLAVFLVFSLLAGLLPGVPAVTPARAADLVTVTPAAPNGWGFFEEEPIAGGNFVNGPATPPSGSGSARMTLADADGRMLLATLAYAGTRLDELTRLEYSTYQNPANTTSTWAISLQLDIDYDLTDADTTWQGRLVYEPYYSETVNTGVWQTWDPLAPTALWWSSLAPGSTECPISDPCTLAEILTLWPNAGLRADVGVLQFKAGGPWEGFDGNVDAFTIGVSGTETTFDFEQPATVYVDDDWTGTTPGTDPDGAGPANSFGGDAFAVIQDGVDGVASGGTVHVANGSYSGTVNIVERPGITITGESRAGVIVQPASTLPWLVPGFPQYDTRQAVVRAISSTNVHLSNMTFDYDLVKGNDVFGLFYWNSTGVLDNNAYQNMSAPDASNNYTEFTSYFRAPDFTGAAPAGVTVSNSVFTDTGRVAVWTGDYVHATIQNNTFSKVIDDFGYAMEIGSVSTAVIEDNVISGYDTPAASDGSTSAGIYIENSFTLGGPSIAKSITVTRNTITGNEYGLSIGNEFDDDSIEAGDVDIQVTLQDNAIHDNLLAGVYVADEGRENGSSVTITGSGNTITANGPAGYHFITAGDGELRAALNRETITGHDTGILVEDTGSPSNSLYDLAVHFSRIVSNTEGLSNTTASAVAATNNWWGCNAGPGETGCDPATGADTTPWLVLGLAPAAGSIPIGDSTLLTADLIFNSNAENTLPDYLPDGVPVDFAGTLGTVTPAASLLATGAATSTFTAGLVSGTAVVSATVDNQTVTDTVTIAGEPVTVQFSSAEYSAPESAGTAMISVTLSAPSLVTSTVSYASSDGAAVAGSDYVTATGVLTFAPGVVTQTFSVSIIDDTEVESAETVNLGLADASPAAPGSPVTATLTIQDNDEEIEINQYLPLILK